MPQANGKITAPVSVADVSLCIGENSLDVKTLCMSKDKIKKWSKYKPVIINSPMHVHPGNNDNWYKGDDGKCGLILPVGTPGANGTAIANLYKSNAWDYNPPGASDWGRLEDFVGYDHNAKPFIYTGIVKGEDKNINLQIQNSLTLVVHHQNIPGSLSISDFDDLGMDLNCKLVATLFRVDPLTTTNPQIVRSYTSEHTVGTAPSGAPYVTVSFDKTDLQAGDNYWILLYLIGTSAGSAVFPIPYDDDNHVLVKVWLTDTNALSGTIINIGSMGQSSPANPIPTNNGESDIQISLGFVNNYGSAVTIGPGGRFNLRAELGSGFGNVELTGGIVTVPANSTNWQGTFTAPKLFKKAIEMLKSDITQIDTTIRITAKDTTGATQSWQALTPAQTIYFKR